MARWTAEDIERAKQRIGRIIANPLVMPAAPIQRKYRNIPTEADGYTFDSKAEAKRYGELKLLEKAGEITNLRLQHSWFLHVNGVRIGYYRSDYDYVCDGKHVIEDVKGVATPIYRWKKRHMKAEYNIDVVEIKA